MADHGALAAREDRREAPAAKGQAWVAHRVDAAVNPVKPAEPGSLRHPSPIEPERAQLRGRDHAVLARREPSQRVIAQKVAP